MSETARDTDIVIMEY